MQRYIININKELTTLSIMLYLRNKLIEIPHKEPLQNRKTLNNNCNAAFSNTVDHQITINFIIGFKTHAKRVIRNNKYVLPNKSTAALRSMN